MKSPYLSTYLNTYVSTYTVQTWGGYLLERGPHAIAGSPTHRGEYAWILPCTPYSVQGMLGHAEAGASRRPETTRIGDQNDTSYDGNQDPGLSLPCLSPLGTRRTYLTYFQPQACFVQYLPVCPCRLRTCSVTISYTCWAGKVYEVLARQVCICIEWAAPVMCVNLCEIASVSAWRSTVPGGG